MRTSLSAFLGGALVPDPIAGRCRARRGAADPSVVPHPRLFMSAAQMTAYAVNAKVNGTAAQTMVASCQEAIDTPKDVTARGGSDGYNWPGTACGRVRVRLPRDAEPGLPHDGHQVLERVARRRSGRWATGSATSQAQARTGRAGL